MDKLTEKSVAEFSRLLADKVPTPGGGGASALVGALGAALGAMVGNYTVGKPKYAAVEEDVKALLVKAEDLRARCLALVDEDAAAFEPLSKAYAIPKDAPGRDAELERCLRLAADAPMKLVRLACEGIDLHRDLERKGSVLMRSDVGTGVMFCWAALYGASLNVKVNTKLMADRGYATKLNAEVDGLVERYGKVAGEIYEKVAERYV